MGGECVRVQIVAFVLSSSQPDLLDSGKIEGPLGTSPEGLHVHEYFSLFFSSPGRSQEVGVFS